jgi:hypothetical protein
MHVKVKTGICTLIGLSVTTFAQFTSTINFDEHSDEPGRWLS